MIISRKRFEEEIQKRVKEAVHEVEESHWRYESDREKALFLERMEQRLIAVEKACSIDHPSHHRSETATATRW